VYNAEKHDHAKQHINAGGVMALCSRMSVHQTEGIFNKEYIDFLNENDIWTMGGGPNWDENLAKCCAYDDVLCAQATMYTEIAYEGEATPVRVLEHYAQNAVNYRVQRYIENYFDQENIHSQIIDFGMIENDFNIWHGLWDSVCPPEQAEYVYTMLASHAKHYNTIPWHGHSTFATSGMPGFVNDVITYMDYPETFDQTVILN